MTTRSFILLATLAVLSGSCKKDHGVLNADVQPQSDVLNASTGRNLPVQGFSMKYDSVLSLNNDLKFIGTNNDSRTGLLDVGLYLNASLSLSNVKFESPRSLVGADITLGISNTKVAGESAAVLNYTIYAVDSVLVPTRGYYTSNRRLHNQSSVLGTGTVTPLADTLGQYLKFSLNQSFAQQLFSNTSALANNTAFQATYKGFYIQTSTAGEGLVVQCNLASAMSGLNLRYLESPTATVTTNFKFSLTGSAVTRFNTVRFSPVSDLAQQFAGDSLRGAQKLYVRGLGASRLKVKIPFLKHYGDTFHVAVNRAEVIFYPDAGYLSAVENNLRYRLPAKLALLAMDSLGREALTLDQKTSTYISRYDGNYDADNKRYVFNIPLHAQAILNGGLKNYGFYLVVADPDPVYAAFRDRDHEACILGGSENASRPVFNFDYIRVKTD